MRLYLISGKCRQFWTAPKFIKRLRCYVISFTLHLLVPFLVYFDFKAVFYMYDFGNQIFVLDGAVHFAVSIVSGETLNNRRQRL